ncbi:hypothetical protein TSUD_142830 [Trifolium subterraneum]|uniref:RNA polymerase subunit H/Rpb5 C-terminal domain-containing protein n=1 Tax=Trifolium subterraneum TaxID=3900 RepID=A0A2Z6NGH8_TRISU|nr:hypothetical protein TSUD_142830 [Trifolium subterraneum]
MVFTDEDVTKLYKIRRTILEMLADRNYDVSETELSMSKTDFKSEFGEHFRREQLEIQKTHKDNPSEKICVFFYDDAKLGVKAVRSVFDRMVTENFTRGILVCQRQLSPSGRKGVTLSNSLRNCHLEVFLEADLIVNITRHERVPEHQVLTNAEKKALLKRFSIPAICLSWNLLKLMTRPEKPPGTGAILICSAAHLTATGSLRAATLPRILINDPIARYYGLNRGQVVRIIRPSETAGRYITYRFVGG